MNLLVSGDVAVTAIATLLGALEVRLYTVQRSSERAWTGLVCLATAAYAALAVAQLEASNAATAVIVQQLQLACVGMITLSVLEYGAVRRGRRQMWPRYAARGVMAVGAIVLLGTHWIVSREVRWSELATVDKLVPEARLADPLGSMFLVFCLALAVLGAWDTLKGPRRSWLLVLGLGVWVAAGLHDLLRITEVLNWPILTLEYGFLAFALALVGQHVTDYTALLSESEHARQVLAQQKDRIEEVSHRVVLSVDEGIVYLDERGRVRLWNPMMEQLTGRTAADSLGLSYSELLPEGSKQHPLRSAIDHVLRTGAPESLEVSLANGRQVAVALARASASPGDRSLIAVLRDVTKERELTEHMMEMDRMIAAGSVAAGVGHEINNPLSYVLGNLQFARERVFDLTVTLGPEATDDLHKALAEATEGARRIRDVVQQLRAMVQPVERQAPHPVAVKQVLSWAAKMAGSEVRSRAVLEQSCDEDIAVLGDESQLGQVFLNLVLNAAHAIQPGAASENRIRLTAQREGNRVRVEVSDTGQGIPTTNLERIFDPFFTTKPAEQGSGLGLAISRRIVQQHGGHLSVESEPGKGTTVIVELPAVPIASMAESTKEQPAPALALGRLRIMIVDDDRPVARSLGRVLGQHHDVVLCDGGTDALRRLAHEDGFDLILTDIMMGEMDGLELFDHIRRDHPALSDHVVFMTGGLITPEARQFQQLYPERVFHKPLDGPELAALLWRFQRHVIHERHSLRAASRPSLPAGAP